MRVIIAVLALTCSSVSAIAACGDSPIPVSMVGIIATPEEFDEKNIQVRGYFIKESAERNRGYLFLSKDDLVRNVIENSVALNLPEELDERAKKLNGKSVIVQGKFDLDDRGPWGLYVGTVSCINRFESDIEN